MIQETRLRKLLAVGEDLQVEFKTCRDALNRWVYPASHHASCGDVGVL